MKKPRIPAALLPAGLLLLAILLLTQASVAWFHTGRRISTPSAIAMPATLDIRGKDNHPIVGIDLSDIALTGNSGSSQFLFCVVGEGTMAYELQLAHTTNVPFQYRIYRARQTGEAPGASWLLYTAEETETTYYYGEPLTLTALNPDPESLQAAALSSGDYYDRTYLPSDEVQPAAMPLFEMSQPLNPGSETGSFLDYYVLEVSWESLTQSKETDMVYLMAQLANEG